MAMFRFAFEQAECEVYKAQLSLLGIGEGRFKITTDSSDLEPLAILFDLFFFVHYSFDHYVGGTPRISEQEVNRSIKDVSELASITQLVEIHINKGGKDFSKNSKKINARLQSCRR